MASTPLYNAISLFPSAKSLNLPTSRSSLDSSFTSAHSFPQRLHEAKKGIEPKPHRPEPKPRTDEKPAEKSKTAATDGKSSKASKSTGKSETRTAADGKGSDTTQSPTDPAHDPLQHTSIDPVTEQAVANDVVATDKSKKNAAALTNATGSGDQLSAAVGVIAAAINPASTPTASTPTVTDANGTTEGRTVAKAATDAAKQVDPASASATNGPTIDTAQATPAELHGAVTAGPAHAATKPKPACALGEQITPLLTGKTTAKPVASQPVPNDVSAQTQVDTQAAANLSATTGDTAADKSDVTASTSAAGVSSELSPAHLSIPTAIKTDTPAPLPPEARFAEANHANIVSGLRTQLLAGGGTMHIRLDPPELGALQVVVEMRNGVMSATFQTSNDDATRLLSHSLGQLKTALEGQGVTVDKIQVQQTPREKSSSNEDPQQQQSHRNLQDEQQARQDQQRKEMLQRMWRKLSIGSEPVDLVA